MREHDLHFAFPIMQRQAAGDIQRGQIHRLLTTDAAQGETAAKLARHQARLRPLPWHFVFMHTNLGDTAHGHE